VRDVSKVLEDLGMPPFQGFPRDPHMTSDVLEAVDVILEWLEEAMSLATGPGIMRYSLINVISVVRPALMFCFCFIFLM
jgi:hypothetical protein